VADILANLATGCATALSPLNLCYCFLGVLLGTLVGVLPGLGPVATIAMLLPATLTLPAESALIMLAGIYYGAQYGGSTTAILINLPGESSSVVTTLDGHAMAQQGRAGAALATAAIGSFFAGTVATFVIAFLAPPLANLALRFQAPEYFSLMVLGSSPPSCWRKAPCSRPSAWSCLGCCWASSAPTLPRARSASTLAFLP
jgi:putative tricarboxylic transport membrane protein